MQKISCAFAVGLIIVLAEKHDSGSAPSWSGSFESQVELLIHRTRLPHTEIVKLSALQDDLLPVLQQRWPGCNLVPIGSTTTGFAMTGSDIKFNVHLKAEIANPPETLVLTAERSFKKFPTLFESIEAPTNVATPYLKLIHTYTNRTAVLVFNRFDYEQDSLLVKYLFKLDHRLYPLMMVIKYWAKHNQLRLSRQIANMVWCKMLIFYLQQTNVLPPIYIIQKNKENYVHNWNVAFEENYQDLYIAENSDSTYKLLGGFFEFYSKFDFGNLVISPYTGLAYRRELFRDVANVPEIFQNYKFNVQNNVTEPINIDTPLCMTGLFDHHCNILEMVSKEMVVKILSCIDKAAELYRKVNEYEFLDVLFE